MKIITIEDIRSWKPCYDPDRYLTEKWQGTVIDILKHTEIPAQDKLWVVCREDLIDAKTLRLFAVWSARQVQHLMKDERSMEALDVAEKYANGEATQAALTTAMAAAMAAVSAAVSAAAWAAVSAAWAAASAAASAATSDAASAAVSAAAWAAVSAATSAATRDAPWAATRDAQAEKLIEMVEEST